MDTNTIMETVEQVTETMTDSVADMATGIPADAVTDTVTKAADFVGNYNFEPEKIYVQVPADGSASFGSFALGAAVMGGAMLVFAGVRKLKRDHDLKMAKKAQKEKEIDHPGEADETVEPEFQREAPAEGSNKAEEPKKDQEQQQVK